MDGVMRGLPGFADARIFEKARTEALGRWGQMQQRTPSAVPFAAMRSF
jgi:hypothetical protein